MPTAPAADAFMKARLEHSESAMCFPFVGRFSVFRYGLSSPQFYENSRPVSRGGLRAGPGRPDYPCLKPGRIADIPKTRMYRRADRSLFVRLLKLAMWVSLAAALVQLLVALFRWRMSGLPAQLLLTCG